jgi:hypothetical protein
MENARTSTITDRSIRSRSNPVKRARSRPPPIVNASTINNVTGTNGVGNDDASPTRNSDESTKPDEDNKLNTKLGHPSTNNLPLRPRRNRTTTKARRKTGTIIDQRKYRPTKNTRDAWPNTIDKWPSKNDNTRNVDAKPKRNNVVRKKPRINVDVKNKTNPNVVANTKNPIDGVKKKKPSVDDMKTSNEGAEWKNNNNVNDKNKKKINDAIENEKKREGEKTRTKIVFENNKDASKKPREDDKKRKNANEDAKRKLPERAESRKPAVTPNPNRTSKSARNRRKKEPTTEKTNTNVECKNTIVN